MMRRLTTVVVAAGLTAACGDVNAALERLSQARRLAADLLVQFTTASNATDRAVMADTDASSAEYAQEAGAAREATRKNALALRPLLATLGYAQETALLDQFEKQFSAYETFDGEILQLAVENTNLKAQQLSFSAAQTAAERFAHSLDAVAPANSSQLWHVKATAAMAVGAVREIQVLQGPHIAAPENASMTAIEARMTAQETIARHALAALKPLADARSQPKCDAARDALNRFMAVNAQIIGFSRRNSNVRSLAMALTQKPSRVAACEQTLRALNDALAHHGLPKGRWE
jgi:hypothetical protein